MPWYALTSGLRHHHHDQERRRLGVRREELPAVDHPLVAVLHRSRREQRRVGAGVRLGHRVAREDLAVEQRPQVALLLLRRAVVGDDLGVAGVGRLAAEDDRRPLRPAEDLVQQRQLELPVPLAAELGAEVRGPQILASRPRPSAGRRSCAACSSSGVYVRRAATDRSSGSTSSRTNVSTQSSFSWNSGSVSKSHAIVGPPSGRVLPSPIAETTFYPRGASATITMEQPSVPEGGRRFPAAERALTITMEQPSVPEGGRRYPAAERARP